MSAPPLWYFHRLRAMAPREVAWRAAAALPVPSRREAAGTPNWHAEPWRDYVAELIRTKQGGWAEDAERIATGTLSMWGHEPKVSPRCPEWHVDPLTDS